MEMSKEVTRVIKDADLRQAVIKAASEWHKKWGGILHDDYSEGVIKAVNNYLASQKEVGEIRPVDITAFNSDDEHYWVYVKLNQVISLVNKLARGK